MGKIRDYIWVLTFVSVCSCSEEVSSDIFGERTPVEIECAVTSQQSGLTRAVTTLNTSSGFSRSSTAAYNKVNVSIDGDDYTYNITAATTLTAASSVPYFPVGASSVAVYARYPDYSADVTKSGSTTYFTIQEDQTSDDAYLRSDLMTAAGTASRSSNGSSANWTVTPATLQFQHQMTKMVVTAHSEDESVVTIKSIHINDVNPRVPITLGSSGYSVGTPTTSSSGTTYDVKVLGSVTGTQSSAAIIPAQTFAPVSPATRRTFCTVTVDFKNPYTHATEEKQIEYYFTGTGKTFQKDKVYTMNITVGVDNFILKDQLKTDHAIDISEWNASDNTSINIFPTVVHTSLRMEGRIQLNITTPKVYTGSMITLSSTELVVQKQNEDNSWSDLTIDVDYVTTYQNNLDAGTATVTVVGIRQYSGTLTADFTISKRDFSAVKIASVADEVYNGYVHRPAVAITEDVDGDGTHEKTLHLDTDFTLSYPSDLTNAGSKTITITPIGNYQGAARTTSFNITKATGSFTLADASVRFYVPNGTTQTYRNMVTITRGDQDYTISRTASPSSSVISINQSSGLVTMSPTTSATTTATITVSVTSSNYSYTPQTYTLKVKSGPILPLMYVASNNMGDLVNGSQAMAEKNWTAFSSHYSWNPNAYFEFNTSELEEDGLTKDGVHYHIPTYYEWLSIVHGGKIRFDTEVAESSIEDADVRFGSINSDLGTTSTYYSKGDGTAYAIRFDGNGNTYRCAYRYDRMVTTDSNQSLTGNTTGRASFVVRAIFLGNTSATISSIQSLDWDNEYDAIMSLPISGRVESGGGPAGEMTFGTTIENGYYWSCSKSSGSNRYYLYIPRSGNVSYSSGYTEGYCMRLFRDGN